MVYAVNSAVLDDLSRAEEKLRAMGYRSSLGWGRLCFGVAHTALSTDIVMMPVMRQVGTEQLFRSGVSESIVRIITRVVLYPSHPYRKLSRYSARLIESYCPSCELLIAASPRKQILDVMERLHHCPVHYRYPKKTEEGKSRVVQLGQANVDR